MIKKTAVVISSYTLTDPTTRNTVYSIQKLFEKIIIIQHGNNLKYSPLGLSNAVVEEISSLPTFPQLFGIRSLLRWIYYKYKVRLLIRKYNPDCIITFQLGTVAAINLKPWQELVSCIYDIPDPDHSGKMDSIINRQGFNKLRNAGLIWTSDEHKCKLTLQLGELKETPLVCYNCPSILYADEQREINRTWLRGELRKAGATISNVHGTVMIRAGAIGPYGGIEETLEAMKDLPPDSFFLMMGRPSSLYGSILNDLIKKYKLEKRAFFWDRPDDQTWKKALFGADIGHLVHLKPPDGTVEAGMFKYNSSLSNYRLFNYMAAGLPIFSYNDPRLHDLHKEAKCFIVLKVADLVQELVFNWDLINKDGALRDRMGQSGHELFRNKYNWEFQFRQIKEFIETM